MNSKIQFEEISKTFLTESEMLESQISALLQKPKKVNPEEIVPVYHQIMNVVSIADILEQTRPETSKDHKYLFEKLDSTKNLVNNVFNTKIHPSILTELSDSIQDIINSLKQNDTRGKTKEEIEKEAKTYDNLRKMMSTKEFVEQYDKLVRK